MTDHRDQFPVTACLDPQNAETILAVVVGDALDQTRQHFPIGWYGLGLHDVLRQLNDGSPKGRSSTDAHEAWDSESCRTNSQTTDGVLSDRCSQTSRRGRLFLGSRQLAQAPWRSRRVSSSGNRVAE